MGIDINYIQATAVQATGTPRQWRIRFETVKNGVHQSHDVLFPDGLQTLVTGGYITQTELTEKLMEIVQWTIRKRFGL